MSDLLAATPATRAPVIQDRYARFRRLRDEAIGALRTLGDEARAMGDADLTAEMDAKEAEVGRACEEALDRGLGRVSW